MKKLFVCLCAGLLLAGCGSDNKKVCKVNENGITGIATAYEGKDGLVEKMEYEVRVPYETIGVSKEEFTDEMKKEYEESMQLVMGVMNGSVTSPDLGVDEDTITNIEDDDDDGLDIKVNYDSDEEVVYTVILTNFEKEVTMQDFQEAMESVWMECK